MTTELKMDRECVLRCDHCDASPYVLFRRQVRRRDGTPGDAFDNILWPNGSGVLPPRDPEKIICPDCRHELVRAPA